MKPIQDFTQLDTVTLFRALHSFKRFLIGFPVILTIPAVGIIALKPQLWWLFPLYVIAILFGAVMIGTAYGRLVAELRVRELEKAEPENREAEDELRESEARFRRLADNAPDMIYRMSLPDGRYEYVSPASTAIFGCPPEAFMNTPALIRKLIHPDEMTFFEEQWKALNEGNIPPFYEYRIIHADSHEVRWIHQSNVLIRDAAGAPIAIEGIVRDITERKQAEQEIIEAKQKAEENEARFRNIFEKSSDAILIIENGIFNDCNMATVAMLEYKTKEDFLNVHPSVLSPEKQPDGRHSIEKSEAMMNLALANGTHRFEWMHSKSSGDIFPVEVLLTAISNEPGNQVIHCVLRDITERKAAESREKDLQDKLARSERLESVGALAGGVAHDLNNSLAPLVTLPQVILDDIHDRDFPPDETTKEMEECLSIIENCAVHSAKVVKDLLHLSGSGQYSLEPFDLNTAACIQGTCSCAINIRSSLSNIRFASALSAEPVMIMADESHLNRAISNLIHNAAESISKDGSVNIRTSVVQTDEHIGSFEDIPPGHYAILEIEDTGGGVDTNDVNHLFEPFFSRKTKGDLSGSGLGLAVVHGIVKDHNSFIDVVSRVGVGTTFTIYFPLMSSPAEPPPVEWEKAATPQGSARILVVDDEKFQRFIISKNLEKLGYDSSVASNGHEAVALFAEAEKAKNASPFDLVLLDMTMEVGFDGLDTYQAIRELYPNQNVIISSGYTDSKRIQAAMNLGAACLPKPYQRCDLAEALRKMLDN